MSLREASDKAAICFGVVTGAALVCAGAEIEAALVAGGLVALMVDIPFGSISHVTHHGTIHQTHIKVKRPPKVQSRSPKPTGYHYGAFGRL